LASANKATGFLDRRFYRVSSSTLTHYGPLDVCGYFDKGKNSRGRCRLRKRDWAFSAQQEGGREEERQQDQGFRKDEWLFRTLKINPLQKLPIRSTV
jgi:hypothetical protein